LQIRKDALNLYLEIFGEFWLSPVFWLVLFSMLGQMGLYLGLFRLMAYKKINSIDDYGYNWPAVSIIICARNEEANLLAFLPGILSQDYPEYEVIVVNDQSLDNTKYVLEDLVMMHSKLKVVSLDEYLREFEGKKLALMLGFKRAAYDVLLLTDADCEPVGPNWVMHMMSGFQNDGTDLVLGVSPYFSKPGLLNALIQFDTCYTAIQYVSFALLGNAYMGVGRNLAYRKSLFFNNKGFAPFQKLISGDDDLFVNRRANSTNTSIQLNSDSFTYSKPKQSWSEWFRQKTRHTHTGKYYKQKHKIQLYLVWFSHITFFISIPLAFVFLTWPLALSIVFCRYCTSSIINYGMLRRMKLVKLLPFWPILEIIYLLVLLPSFSLISWLTGKRNKW